MWSMFNGASAFNQPLNSWDVSSVTDMDFMFNFASAFYHNLSMWQLSNSAETPTTDEIFQGATKMCEEPSFWPVLVQDRGVAACGCGPAVV